MMLLQDEAGRLGHKQTKFTTKYSNKNGKRAPEVVRRCFACARLHVRPRLHLNMLSADGVNALVSEVIKTDRG
jgi:hypothetical protein